jgi:hypothetical protein
MKKKAAVEHHLVALPLSGGRSLHAYLMTTNRMPHLRNACARMLKVAEEITGGTVLPMFVSTGPLSPETTKMVRDILNETPEVKKNLQTATDYHLTVFMPPAEIDARLMEIH